MTTPPMKIESVPIDSLTYDPENARLHGDDNLDAIRNSLERFGQVKPLVVMADGTVIAGNGTLQAAKALGLKKLDIVRIPADWDRTRAMAYAIADNRTAELAKWDGEILSAQLDKLEQIGFTPEVLGFNLASAPEVQQNQTSEIDVNSFSFEHECPECGFEFDGK